MKRFSALITLALTFVQPAYAMSLSEQAALLLAISYCLNKDSGGFNSSVVATAAARVAIQRGIPSYMVTSPSTVDRASQYVMTLGCRRLLSR